MRFSRGGWVLAAIFFTCIVAAALVYGFRQPLGAWAIPKIAGSAVGASVDFGHMALHGSNAEFTGVKITSHAGQQIAYIPRVYLTYSLRDLLPGSQHRFGLHSVLVDHPQITIVHNRDGSYNIPAFKKGPPSNKPAAPLNFTMRLIEGTLSVVDYTRVHKSSQRLYIDNVNVDAAVNTGARTHYVASMNYREGNRLYPIQGSGHLDAQAHTNLQRWSAAHVPLPRLVNYGVNNASIDMKTGSLDNVDLRYFGKLAASAYASGVNIVMSSVSQPLRDGHGRLDLYEGGITTPGLYARLGTMPIRVAGGIADLTHPRFRLTMNASGDLAQLKKLVPKTANLPVRGAVSAALLVEGSVKQPQVLISLRSPRVQYRGMPFSNPRGAIAFNGKSADIVGFQVGYGAFTFNARGHVALASQPNAVEMIAQIRGPSNEVPYASAIVPDMQLHGTILATGDDLKKIDTHGVLEGNGAQKQLAALFNLNNAGVGSVGPLMIEEPNRSLDARIAIDRPHNSIRTMMSARNFTIASTQPASLPGFQLKALPLVRATLDGDVYADKRGNALGMLGNVDLHNARYGGVSLADAHARFGGDVGDVRVSTLDARGSFGRLNASGTISGSNRVALEGRFAGSLSALSQIAGNVPARGTVDAPIALVYDNGRALAQVHNAQFRNASVRGVPIAGLSATIGTKGKTVRVYSARANVAGGGHATVAGTLGKGGRMVVAVSNLNMAALRGAGVPLQAGRADFAATMRGSMTSPHVNGALLLERGRYDRYPVSAESAFAYGGDTLQLRDALLGLGPAFVAMDGSVGGVRMGAPMSPQYDLNASLRGADAHALVAMAQPKLAKQYIEGSIDADVHVGGAGKTPAVSGQVSIPAGSVHGLAFRNMHGTLGGTAQDFALRNGHVNVGTTSVAFAASMGGGAMQAAVSAPHADLADFNDYFDTGDTLAGTGSLAVSVTTSRDTFLTGGSVALSDLRYRRFEIGDASANWNTSGRTVTMIADVGGASGRAHVAGSVTVPPFKSVGELATNADTDLTAHVRGVDLGTWMPMLGYNAPVTGKLDADATVRGRFPDESIAANASVLQGTVGRVQLQRAQVAVQASRGRGRIQQAVVQIPHLTATGSGTFGLHANDPLDLSLRAVSPDIGTLMNSVNGKTQDIAGALDTTLHVTGTRTDPNLQDTLALTSVRYGKLTVPKISGVVTATRTHVALDNGLVQLKRGYVALSGLVPIVVGPNMAIDPPDRPVRFALRANNVDFSNFEAALPEGTHLAGTLAGAMTVNGTIDKPQLNGDLAIQNGYFVGPIDQNPIQKLNGTIAFRGTTVALQSVHADVGGGTLDLNGSASVPDVRDIHDVTFHTTIVAKGAQFNSPQYFRGKVDANVTAERTGPRAIPSISGTVNVPSGRIPLTAFWNPKAPKGPAKKLPDVALNLRATVGNDVRVQSSNVDVGAQGSVTVGGTLPDPKLSGSVTSTGGTVDFFRRFMIESAYVRFDPANGIMPFINANATTSVPDPLTYIALNVRGLAPDNLKLSFSSDPSYDRTQIMALLAGVNQLNNMGQGGTGVGGFSVASTVQNIATGELNTYFTRQMLEPLSAALGNALGLQNLQLTDDFHSGFGVSAVKAFGKHMTATFQQTMASPRRQILKLAAHRKESSVFALMLYNVQSPTSLGVQSISANLLGSTIGSPLLPPTPGNSGVNLTYEHTFW